MAWLGGGARSGCPSDSELADFAAGRAPARAVRPLARHLSACDVCTATVDRFSQFDPLLGMLRAGRGAADDATCDPAREFEAVRDRIADRLFCNETMAATGYATGDGRGPLFLDDPPPPKIRSYLLGGEVGAGAMGRVYRAEHEHLRQSVAIKLLQLPPEDGAARVRRFTDELAALGQCDHPNVVRAYDAGDWEGRYFVAMEFVDGWTLAEMVRRLGPLPPEAVAAIGLQAAQGLAEIHDRGLIHRDVKPSNLMASRRGVVKVLDLGLVHLTSREARPERVGTPDFMAPEQATGERIDPRTDVYGLGACLFTLATGRPPFARHGSKQAKLLAHQSEPVAFDDARRLPPPLKQLLGEMLAKEPAARPNSMKSVAERLRPLASTDQQDGALRRMATSPDEETSARGDLPTLAEGKHGREKYLDSAGAGRFAAGFLAVAAIMLVVSPFLIILSNRLYARELELEKATQIPDGQADATNWRPLPSGGVIASALCTQRMFALEETLADNFELAVEFDASTLGSVGAFGLVLGESRGSRTGANGTQAVYALDLSAGERPPGTRWQLQLQPIAYHSSQATRLACFEMPGPVQLSRAQLKVRVRHGRIDRISWCGRDYPEGVSDFKKLEFSDEPATKGPIGIFVQNAEVLVHRVTLRTW